MAHQILLAGLFPRFDRDLFRRAFHGFVLICKATVEKNRENGKKNFWSAAQSPMKTGL